MAILIQRCPVDLIAHGIERWDTDRLDAYNAVLGARRRL